MKVDFVCFLLIRARLGRVAGVRDKIKKLLLPWIQIIKKMGEGDSKGTLCESTEISIHLCESETRHFLIWCALCKKTPNFYTLWIIVYVNDYGNFISLHDSLNISYEYLSISMQVLWHSFVNHSKITCLNYKKKANSYERTDPNG